MLLGPRGRDNPQQVIASDSSPGAKFGVALRVDCREASPSDGRGDCLRLAWLSIAFHFSSELGDFWDCPLGRVRALGEGEFVPEPSPEAFEEFLRQSPQGVHGAAVPSDVLRVSESAREYRVCTAEPASGEAGWIVKDVEPERGVHSRWWELLASRSTSGRNSRAAWSAGCSLPRGGEPPRARPRHAGASPAAAGNESIGLAMSRKRCRGGRTPVRGAA